MDVYKDRERERRERERDSQQICRFLIYRIRSRLLPLVTVRNLSSKAWALTRMMDDVYKNRPPLVSEQINTHTKSLLSLSLSLSLSSLSLSHLSRFLI